MLSARCLTFAVSAFLIASAPARSDDLFKAIAENKPDIARKLVQDNPKIVNAMKDLYPPLSAAVSHGHLEIVKILLDAKADIERPDKNAEHRPLHEAASRGHKEIAELLIARGAGALFASLGGGLLLGAGLLAACGTRPFARELAGRPFAVLAFAVVTGIAGAAFQISRLDAPSQDDATTIAETP